MGLLKDIYDIVKDNNEAKQVLGDALTSFLRSSLGSKPKIADQLKNQSMLIEKLKDDAFPEAFETPLDYFGIVMAMIAHSAYLKSRGCIISILRTTFSISRPQWGN